MNSSRRVVRVRVAAALAGLTLALAGCVLTSPPDVLRVTDPGDGRSGQIGGDDVNSGVKLRNFLVVSRGNNTPGTLVGVRDVVGQEGLDRVFQVLRAPYAEEPTNWSRRYKANLEKLASGDVIKVAEVVRDLWRRDQDRGLSAGEKRMLAKARQILVSELALAEHTNEDKAETLLDEVLAS